MLNPQRVKILPLIAVAGLLAGCQKSNTFPANGNVTPVNAGAMPTPEASPTATETPSPAETPASPSPAPSPAPAATVPSPGP